VITGAPRSTSTSRRVDVRSAWGCRCMLRPVMSTHVRIMTVVRAKYQPVGSCNLRTTPQHACSRGGVTSSAHAAMAVWGPVEYPQNNCKTAHWRGTWANIQHLLHTVRDRARPASTGMPQHRLRLNLLSYASSTIYASARTMPQRKYRGRNRGAYVLDVVVETP
jgi:hypothetical protein